jgi:flagellin-specific chaperone FliS
MTTLSSGYATSAYPPSQVQLLSPVEITLELYDSGIAACVAGDAPKAGAALVELISTLNFDHEQIAIGLYRLFDYALREVEAERFEGAQRILSELRATWHQAVGVAPAGEARQGAHRLLRARGRIVAETRMAPLPAAHLPDQERRCGFIDRRE